MRFATSVILAIVALAFTPGASAEPFTLYHAGVDPWLGTTHEDDGLVVNAPYNGLHGLVQRASDRSGTGSGWGDGSLVLDSQWHASLGGQALVGALAVVDDARGVASPAMYPGHGQFLAWHGKWLDINADGRIDDIHDASADARDEFLWAGAASGESFAMPIWILPYQASIDSPTEANHIVAPSRGLPLGATHARASQAPDGKYVDLTAREGPEQSWVTRAAIVPTGQTMTDEGFLTTAWVITAANVSAATATERKYDLEDSAGLVDVDRYASVSPDVEAAYNANAAQVQPFVSEPFNEAFLTAYNSAFAALDDAGDPAGTANRVSNPLYRALAPREPNNALDAYPGATWSGATDARGTGTDFSGYAASWHLHADARHAVTTPGAAHADSGPVGVSSGEPRPLQFEWDALPSSSADGNAQRNAMPGFLSFWTDIIVWHDINADKWIGQVCDPATGAGWDASAGECADPYSGGAVSTPQQYSYNGGGATGEIMNACELTNARGNVVTLTPLAPWGGVFVASDIGGPTSAVWSGTSLIGPFTGLEVLTLRSSNACSSPGVLASRDALLLPRGSLSTPFRATTDIALTQRVFDTELGIDVPLGERVIDVDVVPASL